MRLFVSDIKRGLGMWQFWLCVALLTGTGVYGLKNEFLCLTVVEFTKAYGFLGTLNRLFYSFYFLNVYMDYAILACAVILFSTVTCKEMKSGFLANERLRISPNAFILSRILSTLVIGMMAFLLANAITLLVWFIVDPNPSVILEDMPGQMGVLYDHSLWLYCLVYMLYSMLYIGGYSLFSMGAALIWRNQYVGYIVPIIYYYIRSVIIGGFFGYEGVEKLTFFTSKYMISYLHTVAEALAALLIVYIIGISLIFAGYHRWRKGVW